MAAKGLYVEARLLKDFSESLFPCVFGETTAIGSLCDAQTSLGAAAIEAEQFRHLVFVAVTKNLTAKIVMEREFPIVGGQVAGARAGTFKIARLERGQCL